MVRLFVVITGLCLTFPVFAGSSGPDGVLSPPPGSHMPRDSTMPRDIRDSPKAEKCYREGVEQSLSGPELKLFIKSCTGMDGR